MFSKSKKNQENKNAENALAKTPTAKYPKPKILLIDMPISCTDALCSAGYSVNSGSFGMPYKMQASYELSHVSMESVNLPNYTEQEIIIANTRIVSANAVQPIAPGERVDTYWQSCEFGIIDPRPLTMRSVKDEFSKIFQYGGIFIIFAGLPYTIEYRFGARIKYSGISNKNTVACSNFGFLNVLLNLEITDSNGHEFTFNHNMKEFCELCNILKKAVAKAEFHCTLQPSDSQQKNWFPLAKNKFGETIAGILLYDDPVRYIIILPQMPAFTTIILEVLENWCAQYSPQLFPHIEGARWIHRPEYEIPRVLEIQAEIEEITKKTGSSIAELKAEIKKEMNANTDWYTLLQGTGDDLVQAVIRNLRKLGFQQVIDVDAESKANGQEKNLREDIRIHDQSPILIIDVKGVSGHPDDDESRQAEKHVIMRMREWNDCDVQALTIINHQRHLPLHDRDTQAYRIEIIKNAEDTKLGLMTTWDIFKLLKNMDKLKWPQEMVKPIFYRIGRIEPIPEHYSEIGKIVKTWEKAIGIIPTRPIAVEDRLAIETGDTFEEIIVTSLKVDDLYVSKADANSSCGIGSENASKRFREGARVFRVNWK